MSEKLLTKIESGGKTYVIHDKENTERLNVINQSLSDKMNKFTVLDYTDGTEESYPYNGKIYIGLIDPQNLSLDDFNDNDMYIYIDKSGDA